MGEELGESKLPGQATVMLSVEETLKRSLAFIDTFNRRTQRLSESMLRNTQRMIGQSMRTVEGEEKRWRLSIPSLEVPRYPQPLNPPQPGQGGPATASQAVPERSGEEGENDAEA